MSKNRQPIDTDELNYKSDEKDKKPFTELFSETQLEQLANLNVDPEVLQKSGIAGTLAKGLTVVADMNNKTLNNYINSGRFVDVREAEVYVRTVLSMWVDLLKTLEERESKISVETKVPVKQVRPVIRAVSNYLLGSGKEIIEGIEEYTEQFIAEVTGMRGSLGSGAHKRGGISKRGTRK